MIFEEKKLSLMLDLKNKFALKENKKSKKVSTIFYLILLKTKNSKISSKFLYNLRLLIFFIIEI